MAFAPHPLSSTNETQSLSYFGKSNRYGAKSNALSRHARSVHGTFASLLSDDKVPKTYLPSKERKPRLPPRFVPNRVNLPSSTRRKPLIKENVSFSKEVTIRTAPLNIEPEKHRDHILRHAEQEVYRTPLTASHIPSFRANLPQSTNAYFYHAHKADRIRAEGPSEEDQLFDDRYRNDSAAIQRHAELVQRQSGNATLSHRYRARLQAAFDDAMDSVHIEGAHNQIFHPIAEPRQHDPHMEAHLATPVVERDPATQQVTVPDLSPSPIPPVVPLASPLPPTARVAYSPTKLHPKGPPPIISTLADNFSSASVVPPHRAVQPQDISLIPAHVEHIVRFPPTKTRLPENPAANMRLSEMWVNSTQAAIDSASRGDLSMWNRPISARHYVLDDKNWKAAHAPMIRYREGRPVVHAGLVPVAQQTLKTSKQMAAANPGATADSVYSLRRRKLPLTSRQQVPVRRATPPPRGPLSARRSKKFGNWRRGAK